MLKHDYLLYRLTFLNLRRLSNLNIDVSRWYMDCYLQDVNKLLNLQSVYPTTYSCVQLLDHCFANLDSHRRLSTHVLINITNAPPPGLINPISDHTPSLHPL